MKRTFGAAALLLVTIAAGNASAEELRGKVLRWDQRFGALHLAVSTGDEVVVPISSGTKIEASFGELVDGKIFEPDELVTISREVVGGPITVSVETPAPDADIEPGDISDGMEATQETSPTASPSPEPTATADPEPSSTADPEPLPVENEMNLKEPSASPVPNVLE